MTIAQARGDPHTGSFSGVIAGLREACGLMTEGFQQVCLDVEVVVRKMIEDAVSDDRAKAAQDLALRPIFDSDGVSETDMMNWVAYAWKTGQMISDRILGHSREVAQTQLDDGGPVQSTLLQSSTQVWKMCRYLGKSGLLGPGNTGSTHSGKPSGCVPGCLVSAYVLSAAGDHLHGGRPSQSSSSPRGPNLGHTSVVDPAIHSSDSGAQFLGSS